MQPLPHFSGKKSLSLTDLETQREHVAALQNKMQSITAAQGSPHAAQRFAYNNAEGLDVDFVAASPAGEDMRTLSDSGAQPYISQPDIFGVVGRVRALSMREINSGWANRDHIYRGDAALPRAHCPEGAIPSGVDASGILDTLEASGVATCGLMTSLQWAPSGVTEPYIHYGVGYIPASGAGSAVVANYGASGVADTIGSISSVTYTPARIEANINAGAINMSAPDTTGRAGSWGAVSGVIMTARADGSGVVTSVLPPGTPAASTPAWWQRGALVLNLDAIGRDSNVAGMVDINGSGVIWQSLGDYGTPTTHTRLTSERIGGEQVALFASTLTDGSGKQFLALRLALDE